MPRIENISLPIGESKTYQWAHTITSDDSDGLIITGIASGLHVAERIEVPIAVDSREFGDLSWAEIAVLDPLPEHIGQSKHITLNREAFKSMAESDIGDMEGTVTVVGINHDERSDGSGKARFTFKFDWIPARYYISGWSSGWFPSVNNEFYSKSAMHTWIHSTLINALPDDLASQLTPVNKSIMTSLATNIVPAQYGYYEDSLWLFAEVELWGDYWSSSADLKREGEQYTFFQPIEGWKLKPAFKGALTSYWMRTKMDTTTYRLTRIEDTTGGASVVTNSANTVAGVVPGFCVG